MAKNQGFADIIDEMNWHAVVMSEGNFEAVREFVAERNKLREKEQTKLTEKEL